MGGGGSGGGGGAGGGDGSVHESTGCAAQFAVHLNCGSIRVTDVIHEMPFAIASDSVDGHVPNDVASAT